MNNSSSKLGSPLFVSPAGDAHDLLEPVPASPDELYAHREEIRRKLEKGEIYSTVMNPRTIPGNHDKLLA